MKLKQRFRIIKQALDLELREHKSSFIVYIVLRRFWERSTLTTSGFPVGTRCCILSTAFSWLPSAFLWWIC